VKVRRADARERKAAVFTDGGFSVRHDKEQFVGGVWRTEGERNSKARTRAGDRDLAQGGAEGKTLG
jgi:hypothetical protein